MKYKHVCFFTARRVSAVPAHHTAFKSKSMLGVTANVHVPFIMYVRRNCSTARHSTSGDARPMARAGGCGGTELPVMTVKSINRTSFIVSKRKHTQQSGKCTPGLCERFKRQQRTRKCCDSGKYHSSRSCWWSLYSFLFMLEVGKTPHRPPVPSRSHRAK